MFQRRMSPLSHPLRSVSNEPTRVITIAKGSQLQVPVSSAKYFGMFNLPTNEQVGHVLKIAENFFGRPGGVFARLQSELGEGNVRERIVQALCHGNEFNGDDKKQQRATQLFSATVRTVMDKTESWSPNLLHLVCRSNIFAATTPQWSGGIRNLPPTSSYFYEIDEDT